MKTASDRVLTLELKNQQLRAEIDAAWQLIENCYDIESRTELEKEATVNGFKYGLAQAVFHLHKRNIQTRVVRNATLDEAARAAYDMDDVCNCADRIRDRILGMKFPETPATTLRELWRLASDAVHCVHAFMQKRKDDWWKEIYKHQCEMGMVIEGRTKAYEREERASERPSL